MTTLSKTSTDILWCCHVRGPDEVHAAPDYATALEWSDSCLVMDRSVDRISDPFMPYLSAIPAPWPYCATSHASDLPKSIAYFELPADAAETERVDG